MSLQCEWWRADGTRKRTTPNRRLSVPPCAGGPQTRPCGGHDWACRRLPAAARLVWFGCPSMRAACEGVHLRCSETGSVRDWTCVRVQVYDRGMTAAPALDPPARPRSSCMPQPGRPSRWLGSAGLVDFVGECQAGFRALEAAQTLAVARLAATEEVITQDGTLKEAGQGLGYRRLDAPDLVSGGVVAVGAAGRADSGRGGRVGVQAALAGGCDGRREG